MSDRTPSDDRKLARDVAKHIDHRRIRRRLSLWTFLLLIVAIGALYLRFGGGGLGLLGAGQGTGEGGSGSAQVASAPRPLVGQKRCMLRLGSDGITVDQKPMSLADAIRACEAAGSAHVLVTGDAKQGDWDELKAALAKSQVDGKLTDVAVEEPGGSAAH